MTATPRAGVIFLIRFFLCFQLLKSRELETKLAEAKATQARIASEQALLQEQRETQRYREECEALKQRFDAHQVVEEKLKEQVVIYLHALSLTYFVSSAKT